MIINKAVKTLSKKKDNDVLLGRNLFKIRTILRGNTTWINISIIDK